MAIRFDSSTLFILYPTSSLPSTIWHHSYLTLNSGAFNSYVDAVSYHDEVDYTGTTFVGPVGNSFFICPESQCDAEFAMKDVRVWNSLISYGSISAAIDTLISYQTTNLVAYWPLS